MLYLLSLLYVYLTFTKRGEDVKVSMSTRIPVVPDTDVSSVVNMISAWPAHLTAEQEPFIELCPQLPDIALMAHIGGVC